MVFYGVSEIIYVYLLVTAAQFAAERPGSWVFFGFTAVFGLALAAGFGLSALLYGRFQAFGHLYYSLVSLAIIAASILFAPVLLHTAEPQARPPAKDSIGRPPVGPSCTPPAAALLPPHLAARLTERENQVVALLLRGSGSRQIAETLHIAPSTVKVHCRNIYEKLKVHNRMELAALCLGNGRRPL
jgi:DNA-binding CsgD family transcriptional regulator